MKAKKIVLTVDLALFAVMFALDITYMFVGTTLLKSVISLLFVVIGVINTVFAVRSGVKSRFVTVMPIALTVAMVGDIAINFDFIAGAAVFALGHVFYVAAYYLQNKFKIRDLIFSVCVFVPSVLIITLVPAFNFGGVLMEIVCVVYALILSMMTGKALSDFTRKDKYSIAVAAGSILFFASDLALLINEFAVMDKAGRFATRVLCLATYYPGQFLLAFAIFLFALQAIANNGNDQTAVAAEQ